jgi:hypothetical protein
MITTCPAPLPGRFAGAVIEKFCIHAALSLRRQRRS